MTITASCDQHRLAEDTTDPHKDFLSKPALTVLDTSVGKSTASVCDFSPLSRMSGSGNKHQYHNLESFPLR
jgi:hypothetical protein